MTGHIRKIAVRLRVGPEDFHIGKIILRQHGAHGRRTDAVQRRVDDLQIARARSGLREHGLAKPGVDVVLAQHDLAGGNALCRNLAA